MRRRPSAAPLYRTMLLLAAATAACDGAAIVSRPPVDAATRDVVAPEDVSRPDVAAADAPEKDAPVGDAPRDTESDGGGPAEDAGVEPAAAVSGWLSGQVFDVEQGAAVANAEVRVEGAAGARTDDEGAFSLTLPRGVYTVSVTVEGRLPFRSDVLVGQAPTTLAIPLVSREIARAVAPEGTTLRTHDGATLTFPAGAVAAPVNVSATWIDPYELDALDAPRVIDTGDGSRSIARAALVVSDVAVDLPVRVRLPLPQDLLAEQTELRVLSDDGRYTERLEPVAQGGGFVEFDVAHFSTYVMAEKRPPPPEIEGCEAPTAAVWLGVRPRRIVRNDESIDLSPRGSTAAVDARCEDAVPSGAGGITGAQGTLQTLGLSGGFRLTHRGWWREVFSSPVESAATELRLTATATGRVGASMPDERGPWDVSAENGATALVMPIACTNSRMGFAVAHVAPSGVQGRVVVVPPGAAPFRVPRGGERRFCPDGSVPMGRAALASGLCLAANGCPAGQSCDPVTQRCFVARGAACSETARCAATDLCEAGRCVQAPRGPDDPAICRTDADCPDERCDRSTGTCGPPPTAMGARGCSSQLQCPVGEDCAEQAAECEVSGYRACVSDSDCRTDARCLRWWCVRRGDLRCGHTPDCPRGMVCENATTCVPSPVCRAGEGLCGDRCTSLETPENCRGCGVRVTARPNATASCGAMGPTFRCLGGFADCDRRADNGCETSLSSATSCGGCGVACGAGTSCVAGSCSAVPRSTVAQVVLGRSHGCARYANGRVRCWGASRDGAVGDGSGLQRDAPVDVGLDGVAALTSGADHVCAVRTDNTLWCWGRNQEGQHGDGRTGNRLSPALTLRDVAAAAAGDDFTCARRVEGSLWCFGNNASGQLAGGVLSDVGPRAVSLDGGGAVVQIAAGSSHACARTADGAAWCWGRGNSGQVGLGTMSRSRPFVVLRDVAELSLGGDVSVARKTDGSVVVFGANANGQSGDGRAFPAGRPTPYGPRLPGMAAEIAAGPFHVCARLADQRVACWGSGEVVRSYTPAVVSGLDAPLRAITVGAQNACAIRASDSAVLCWGSGEGGMMSPSGSGARAAAPRVMTAL